MIIGLTNVLNCRSVLSQCITRLRLLRFLYDIEVRWRKTIKHAFAMFYTVRKQGILSNQSVYRVLSKIYIQVYTDICMHIYYRIKFYTYYTIFIITKRYTSAGSHPKSPNFCSLLPLRRKLLCCASESV